MDGSSAIVAHTIAEEPAVEETSGRIYNFPRLQEFKEINKLLGYIVFTAVQSLSKQIFTNSLLKKITNIYFHRVSNKSHEDYSRADA